MEVKVDEDEDDDEDDDEDGDEKRPIVDSLPRPPLAVTTSDGLGAIPDACFVVVFPIVSVVLVMVVVVVVVDVQLNVLVELFELREPTKWSRMWRLKLPDWEKLSGQYSHW